MLNPKKLHSVALIGEPAQFIPLQLSLYFFFIFYLLILRIVYVLLSFNVLHNFIT